MSTVVYHWWPEPEDPHPYQNLRAPILLSIATLRAVSDVPVVVLQAENNKDWDIFPDKLNFKIENIEFSLEKYKNKIAGFRHLSRIHDVNKWACQNAPESDVVYVDSDVFFFQNPFPLSCSKDRFCWNGWNTGFFYYNQGSEIYSEFFDTFDTYTRSAIHSSFIRKFFKGYIGYDAWYGVWDEMILGYMKVHHPNLFDTIPLEEHSTVRDLGHADARGVKIFHANGSMVPNPFTKDQHSRGLLCLLAEEFREKILKVFSGEDILKIFGKDLVNWSQDKQFSLIKKANLVKMIKDQSGHYDITNFASKKNKMNFI